jgi:Mycobacterial cell wall arabinan synthesis protein
VRIAAALAVAGLLAALVGALGPAERLRTTYSWPPPDVPESAPPRLWYTPLLLSRHEPAIISASIPCSLPPALGPSTNPALVLATSRSPAQANGLAVTRADDQLVVRVGDDVLARARFPAGTTGDTGCAFRLHLEGGSWWLYGGPDDLERAGRLLRMPTVTGLFSGLELGSDVAPSIDVTTKAHASRTTLRQTLAWAIALLAIGSALLLIALGGRRGRSLTSVARSALTGMRHAGPADAVVGLVLVGWLVIAPAFWDDGHILTTQRMFSSSDGFSFYYSVFGANVPLGYWLDWTRHWLAESSSSLLVLRLPALLCLAATWVVCRWMLSRLVGPGAPGRQVALWALTCAFLTGALAWGMTLRPEPAIALIAAVVMACAFRFRQRETAAPLVWIAILVPLALTAHHTGVVTLAPLLAIAPALIRWTRARWRDAAIIVTASAGLFLVLAFIGSDFAQRRADAELTRANSEGLTAGWHEEATRYFLLADAPYGTTLRRASVALIALAVVAFVARPRRARRNGLLDFPAITLLCALGLLVLTPSKWPWHFGAVLAIAAVAVAAESARVREQARGSQRWSQWPFFAVAAACAAAAWSWTLRTSWGGVDLRTLDWTPELESWVPVSHLASALPLLLLAAALVRARYRGASQLPAIPWRVASWTAPLVSVPLIVFTAAVLIADMVKTPGWTLARQNLEAVWRDQGCGLADDLDVPHWRSVEPLRTVTGSDTSPGGAWSSSPIARLPQFSLTPGESGSAKTPWFLLRAGRRTGVLVSPTARASDRLALEWGRFDGPQIAVLGTSAIDVDFASDVSAADAYWRVLAAAELPPPIPGATVARVTRRAGRGAIAPIAVTPLVTYGNRSLARQLDSARSPTLVHPALVTYLPCVQQPRLRNGIVEAPGHIVTTSDSLHAWEFTGASPFDGVLDLYRLNRLPVADSRNPRNVAVFAVDRNIPGARQLLPVEKTSTS